MIAAMKSTLWLKRGALAIALFAAGAVAGDFAVRGSKGAAPAQVASAPVQVVHKRTVRTVHVHPHGGSAAGSSAATPSVAAVPVSAPTATPVSSSASPGAAGGAAGGGEGGEVERGD